MTVVFHPSKSSGSGRVLDLIQVVYTQACAGQYSRLLNKNIACKGDEGKLRNKQSQLTKIAGII